MVGGDTRVKIQSGEDIRHLGELDEKMWTVLSCPVSGLEIAEESLSTMDLEGDKRLRVREVVAASEWLCKVLRDPQILIRGGEELLLQEIVDEEIAAVAAEVSGDGKRVTLAEVRAAIEAAAPELEVAPEAPYAADVVAACKARKEEYERYYAKARHAEMGLDRLSEEDVAPGMSEAKYTEMSAAIAAWEKAVADTEAKNAKRKAEAVARYMPLKKLLLLQRDYYTLLRNYVSLEDLYDTTSPMAIFQAGRLIIDERECRLCMRVEDIKKHEEQAARSGMYLAYCDCVSEKLGKKMQIVAAVTSGDVQNLMVGKNAVFYDRQDNDWDATIVKIVDNPISISQAFWSPYKKFADWVSGLINKSVAEQDSKGLEAMKSAAEEKTTALKEQVQNQGQTAQPLNFDIAKFAGIFAAIGLAIGAIGTALASVATGLAKLEWWQLILVIVGLLLCISGPSMLMAYFKLRKRNLAPLLNANGWAINSEVVINMVFGATLTSKVQYPLLKLVDPFAEKGMPLWKKLLYAVGALGTVVVVLWIVNAFAWCGWESPLQHKFEAAKNLESLEVVVNTDTCSVDSTQEQVEENMN